jgi:hypothetical protein
MIGDIGFEPGRSPVFRASQPLLPNPGKVPPLTDDVDFPAMGDNFSLNMEAVVKRKEGRRYVSRRCIFTEGRGGGRSLEGKT